MPSPSGDIIAQNDPSVPPVSVRSSPVVWGQMSAIVTDITEETNSLAASLFCFHSTFQTSPIPLESGGRGIPVEAAMILESHDSWAKPAMHGVA